ncbi:MAG: glycosyl transferase family protein [Candidatus Peregrinibacteria bacterium Greene1014_49]|nr:MAG: glycosyl transferase family protein [Candidatus Peregrinibacteria bacterium Greene1014_49]
MKVALVHELLTMKGGAERVLRILAEMFPDAPIYTLLYDEKKLGDWFPKERVRFSNQQPETRNPFPWKFNHHVYLSRFPQAVEAWDFSAFDLVISSSSAFAHNIITNGKPKHLSFVNSPARYLWDRTHDVLEQAGKGLLGPLKRTYLERTFHNLRLWDSESSARADRIIVSSKEVQRRVELYWRRESTVVYPPIDDFWLHQSQIVNRKSQIREQMQHPDYFLVVSTLVPYKRIDLAIEACTRLGVHLKIVGEGSDRQRLERMANRKSQIVNRKSISFYGYRRSDELADLYVGASATIVPGDEDFNLVALESMACGTPVIAYAAGGPLETIIEGKTGEFFREPTAASLQEIMEKYDQKMYSSEECRAQAKQFSKEKFLQSMEHEIENVMQGNENTK